MVSGFESFTMFFHFFLSSEVQRTYEKAITLKLNQLWFVRLISISKEKFNQKISSKYISEILRKQGNCLNEFSLESLAGGILEGNQEEKYSKWKNKHDYYYAISYYLEEQKIKLLLRIEVTMGESIQLVFYANENDINDGDIIRNQQRFIQCQIIQNIFKNYF